MNKQQIQALVDEVQRRLFLLKSEGYDVSGSFKDMRRINCNLPIIPAFEKIERAPAQFSQELLDEVAEFGGAA